MTGLQEQVEKLKKNEDNIPRKDLLTRYLKSYNALRAKIFALAVEEFWHTCTMGMAFEPGDLFSQHLADKILTKTSFSTIKKLVLEEKNLDEFSRYTDFMRKASADYYMAYFNQHILVKEGKPYSTLICMFYNKDLGIWERQEPPYYVFRGAVV